MRTLLCDSGPLIATSDRDDKHHAKCVRLLAAWPGKVIIPEPVLGETCNFLRNGVRRGALLEADLLQQMVHESTDWQIVNPTHEDRARATELVRRFVDVPMGYVDATVIAMAERLHVTDVATIDTHLTGLAIGVSKIKPISWAFQELF
ncbi:PIN domain-containing protein [Sphaerisporangium sp. NPDC051017]|uniref:type II toxin-antitoxin system VapC family toxin n=1 Tax=Sphaerisporangium sp. NPDC051017 TaxID=3154636 RepID=UPI003422448F